LKAVIAIQQGQAPALPALLLTVSLMMGAFVVGVATTADAHTCSANSHAGCNGHNCPDDGVSHNHYTAHPFWWDHYCTSSPSNKSFTGGCTYLAPSELVAVHSDAAALDACHWQGVTLTELSLTIHDDVIAPVSATFCIDQDLDGFCEMSTPFCSSLTATNVVSGRMTVFLHGPFNGSLLANFGAGNPCGSTYSGATSGVVSLVGTLA
jgi:hypothetical protein